MLQAELAGVLDFREARPLDPAWNRRAEALLAAIARKEELKYLERLHDQLMVSLAHATGESATKLHEAAGRILERIDLLYHPWKETTESHAEAKKAVKGWEKAHGGSLKDPDIAAAVRATADALYAIRAARVRREKERTKQAKNYRTRARKQGKRDAR